LNSTDGIWAFIRNEDLTGSQVKGEDVLKTGIKTKSNTDLVLAVQWLKIKLFFFV